MTEELTKYQVVHTPLLSRDQVDLIKRTILKNATDDELALFVQQCNRTQLDPFARQIYGRKQKAWNSETKSYEDVLSIQVSIDGFRLIAERTGHYGGQLPTLWCGKDGHWVDVWLEDGPPAAAKASIVRTDWQHPIVAIAKYTEYVQLTKDGKPNSMWTKMPANQLAKCAESLAFRKGFPQELSGLYTVEEMGQADNVVEITTEHTESNRLDRPEQPALPSPSARPYPPDRLKAGIQHRIARSTSNGDLCTDAQRGLVVGKLEECFADDQAEAKRHLVLDYLTGNASAKLLTKAQAQAILEWLVADKDDTGDYPLKAHVAQEAALIVRLMQEQAGQVVLPGMEGPQ